MRISVIVPFLDEAIALPATLRHLERECAAYGDVEIIAVDGGSTDASRSVLARHRAVHVISAHRGRARQMNAAAAMATGDVLLFLHADTWLPEGALVAIACAARSSGFTYGGFQHRFSGGDWRLRLISALHNYRCRKALTFYGDQAMFVRQSAFAAIGGFPDTAVEDIAISQRLKTLARPVVLPQSVTTSSRKFERMGIWTSFGRVLAILLCLRTGRKPPPAFFADIR